MRVIIKASAEDTQLEEEIEMVPTENYNFISMKVRGVWFDVVIADLYRATMPFMDLRHEDRSES